jgi:GxxExxY protein
MKIDEITEKIIGCADTLANELGHGFLEKVYENALTHELRKTGLTIEQQRLIPVMYDGIVVGDYTVDLLVANEVLVALKTVKNIDDIHVAQCLNYLKATDCKICLLINFGNPRVEIKRIVNNK